MAADGAVDRRIPVAEEAVPEMIRRARLALGLSQQGLARRLADACPDLTASPEIVARWERGTRVPGPRWRDVLGQVLDLPAGALERAATAARLRRALLLGMEPTPLDPDPETRPAAPRPRTAGTATRAGG